MYHDYIRRRLFRTVACAIVILIGVIMCVAITHTDTVDCTEARENAEEQATEIIHDQPQKTEPTQIDAEQSVQASPPKEPTTISANQRVEAVEKEPEHKYYYIMENDIRHDFPIEYQDYLWELCKKYSCTDYYDMFIAMIYHESNFHTDIISKSNDYGLMQINKINHEWLAESLGLTDMLDPYQNMEAGIYIISGFLNKHNDAHYALMCYNMGETGAKRSGVKSSTYSRGVIDDMKFLYELEE